MSPPKKKQNSPILSPPYPYSSPPLNFLLFTELDKKNHTNPPPPPHFNHVYLINLFSSFSLSPPPFLLFSFFIYVELYCIL